MSSKKTIVAVVALGALAGSAAASDWLFRVGAHNVDPKSNGHPALKVESATSLTLSATYFATPNWAIEVLGAVPFEHDIKAPGLGLGKVASTKHLPPTVSVQYHFMPDAKFRPYVGAGLNYTFFFDKKAVGALAGTKVYLDSSFGPAAEVGADIALNDKWAINLNARWIDIDTKARSSALGALGTVHIDPIAIGLMVTRKVSFGD
jgi:outer membrane protein